MKWCARLPRPLPDAGNAHFVFAVKTETGYRTELCGTVDAKQLLDLFSAAASLEKHKEGDPHAYPQGDS